VQSNYKINIMSDAPIPKFDYTIIRPFLDKPLKEMPEWLQQLLHEYATGQMTLDTFSKKYSVSTHKALEIVHHPNVEKIVSEIREESLKGLSKELQSTAISAVRVIQNALENGIVSKTTTKLATDVLKGLGMLIEKSEVSGNIQVIIPKENTPDFKEVVKDGKTDAPGAAPEAPAN
jgi:hypothetical protein